MRIISGSLKGKSINDNRVASTHPMSEKLRGAIFNALGDIEGLSVLDGCAGTGMVGFEALSRGASIVDSVERDDRAFAILVKNAKTILGVYAEFYRPFHYGIRQFFKKNNLKPYDVMIFDPPYDIVQTDHFDGISKHLKQEGIVIFSLPSHIDPPRLPNLEPIRQKKYGVAQLIFYTLKKS
jgi:16S rRNA (guanine966-N2)-methyltransferase